jgi:hypothetical protein
MSEDRSYENDRFTPPELLDQRVSPAMRRWLRRFAAKLRRLLRDAAVTRNGDRKRP